VAGRGHGCAVQMGRPKLTGSSLVGGLIGTQETMNLLRVNHHTSDRDGHKKSHGSISITVKEL
jgi:hypothetical protein